MRRERTFIIKIDFDHVDFEVAARNAKVGYFTANLTGYQIAGIPTSTNSVKEAVLSFFAFVDMI